METYLRKDVLDFYIRNPFNMQQTSKDAADYIKFEGMSNTFRFISPVIPLINEDTVILDIGCGVGWLSNTLSYHTGCRVLGVDMNPVAIERAKEVSSLLGNGAEFICQDLFKFIPEEKVDLALSIGVLHHTDSVSHGISHICKNMVKDGGRVFIGLYHKYGREPFLKHFEDLKKQGLTEDDLFQEYCKLNPAQKDLKHLRSWFYDQVLHPFETVHTVEEMIPLLKTNNTLFSGTSINRFGPVDDLEDIYSLEKKEKDRAENYLKSQTYYPGFFTFMARKFSI